MRRMTMNMTQTFDIDYQRIMHLRSVLILRYHFLWITVVAIGNLQAQPGLEIPKLQPSGITAYDVEDGLPITCTFNGILDADDKLWINACFGQEEHWKTSFYRFDGNGTFTIDWSERPEGQYEQAVLGGFFPDGKMYGFFRHSPLAFTYDRMTHTVTYYRCPGNDSEIYFIGIDEMNRIVLYAVAPDAHLVYIIQDGQVTLLASVARHEFEFPHGNDWWLPQSHLLTGSDLWFFDRNNIDRDDRLIHVDLRTGTASSVPLNIDSYPKTHSGLTHGGRLILDRKGRLNVFLIDPCIRFILNAQTGEVLQGPVILQSQPSLNIVDNAGSPVWSDDHGNLLYTFASGANGFRAILEDPEGRKYDYTPILDAAKAASRFPNGSIRAICGRDLLNQVYIFTDGGLVSIELQSHAGIRVLIPGFATRAIQTFSSEEYLVVLPESGDNKLNIIDRVSGQINTSRSAIPILEGKNDFFDHADIHQDKHGNIWIPQYSKFTLSKTRDGQRRDPAR
jgi:hypothetical protein